MKKTHDNTESSSTTPNLACRAITWVAAFCLGFQPISPAFSMVMTDAGIQNDLSANHEFFRDNANRDYQYIGSPYVKAKAPKGNLTSIEKMLEEVIEKHDRAVGGPKHVPIGMNGITLFVPTYPDYKIVGDPLVQSRFVRAQLRALLGRTLIDSQKPEYKSEAAQLETLYGNALQHINSLPTAKVGEKQAFAQDEAPARSMIWPELRTINGEEVLVPIVYLTESEISERKVLTNDTTFVAGGRLGDLQIDGTTIMLGRNAFLNILNSLTNNGGSILGAGDLRIEAGGELENLSGLIKAKGDLVIGAKSITSGTIVHQYQNGAGGTGGFFGEIASIESDGTVVLRASEDIVIAGSTVSAGQDIKFGADGNIFVGTVQLTTSSREFRDSGWRESRSSAVEYLGSTLTAEQNIELIAGGEIQIDASEITAESGHISVLAGLGITITDKLNENRSQQKGKFGKTSKEVSAYKAVAMRSLLDAGEDLTLHAEFGDITLKAVDISTTQGTTAKADVGAVNLLVTRETDHYSYSETTENLFTIETVNRGHDIETIVPPTIVGGFDAQPLYGLNVEYEGIPEDELDPTRDPLDQQLDALKTMPGLEWIAEAQALNDVNWVQVQGRYEEWNERNRTLSPAAIAVITIAVAIATSGAGASIGGAIGATSTASTAAIGAASTSLITAATIASTNAVLNGENPLDAAFRAITDEDTLISAATSAVTAGAISALDAEFFNFEEAAGESAFIAQTGVDSAGNAVYGLNLVGQASQVALHGAVSATTTILAEGGSFSDFDDLLLDNIRQSYIQNAVNQVGQFLATEIGVAVENGDLDSTLALLAHAGSGCVTASLTSLDDIEKACVSGAGGAVIGELLGMVRDSTLVGSVARWEEGRHATQAEILAYGQRLLDQGLDITKVVAALGAVIADLDPNLAAQSAQFSYLYNATSLAMSALATAASGQTLYRWIDADGVVHLEQAAPTDLEGITGLTKVTMRLDMVVAEVDVLQDHAWRLEQEFENDQQRIEYEKEAFQRVLRCIHDRARAECEVPLYRGAIKPQEENEFHQERTEAQLRYTAALRDLALKGELVLEGSGLVCEEAGLCVAVALVKETVGGNPPTLEEYVVTGASLLAGPAVVKLSDYTGDALDAWKKRRRGNGSSNGDGVPEDIPSINGTSNLPPVPAAGATNFMESADQFFLNARNRTDVDPNGYFDVVAHGSANKIQINTPSGSQLVDHRTAARLIQQQPGYNGQSIRLLSCSTGQCDTGFAQNLANQLGVKVEAPSDILWAYPNGRLVVAPRSTNGGPDLSNQGTFRSFEPGGNR